MDQSLKSARNTSQPNNNEIKKISEVTDPKLIDCSEIIFNEISEKHKVNGRKLRKLIGKNVLICQNSYQFEEMFKNEVFKELDSHFDDYKKLEAYQELSNKLDSEVSAALNDLKVMEFNIGESRFVESFKNLSENIKLTKSFLEESKAKVDNIYERIHNRNKLDII